MNFISKLQVGGEAGLAGSRLDSSYTNPIAASAYFFRPQPKLSEAHYTTTKSRKTNAVTMATRPTVTIASHDGTPSGSTHPLPAVFKAPIRPDIVQ